MSSRASWERGRRELERISDRGFGEVFVALDKKSNDLVAIKRVKPLLNEDELENEWKLLKECQSRYIVRYYDVLRREAEFWVRCVDLGNDVDCDGVLSLRVAAIVFGPWVCFEGGGVA